MDRVGHQRLLAEGNLDRRLTSSTGPASATTCSPMAVSARAVPLMRREGAAGPGDPAGVREVRPLRRQGLEGPMGNPHDREVITMMAWLEAGAGLMLAARAGALVGSHMRLV